jgi:glucose/arabinose dehydrogenase
VKLTRRKIYISLGIVVAIVVVLAGLLWWNFRAGRVTDLPTAAPSAEAPAPGDTGEDTPLAVSLAQGLEIPWALDFLPDGRIILTERPGRIRLYDLERDFGRLREVMVGSDGLLYLLTSNRDGRGLPTAKDDQLIVINPRKLR